MQAYSTALLHAHTPIWFVFWVDIAGLYWERRETKVKICNRRARRHGEVESWLRIDNSLQLVDSTDRTTNLQPFDRGYRIHYCTAVEARPWPIISPMQLKI